MERRHDNDQAFPAFSSLARKKRGLPYTDDWSGLHYAPRQRARQRIHHGLVGFCCRQKRTGKLSPFQTGFHKNNGKGQGRGGAQPPGGFKRLCDFRFATARPPTGRFSPVRNSGILLTNTSSVLYCCGAPRPRPTYQWQPARPQFGFYFPFSQMLDLDAALRFGMGMCATVAICEYVPQPSVSQYLDQASQRGFGRISFTLYSD